MNWPIYMDWDQGSRRCYSRLLIVYAALVIISVVLFVVRFLDVMTLIFTVISILVLVLVATGYMILRNPPLESPELFD